MKNKKEMTPMITKSRLKSERGWTDKLIETFAPVPDLTKPNPNYRSSPPMLLFNLEKIERIEQTEEFKIEQARATKRKLSAKKAVKTKREQMWEWLNTVQIHVPTYEKAKLIKRACDHYNYMREEREINGRSTSGRMATINSEKKFIERICVNYLRHCLTKYEEYLDEMSGKVGFAEGYEEIRRKIFNKISEKYQWLEHECNRQKES